MAFPINQKPIPYLTTAQMVEVDRAMIEDYHIELIQMMENAGRNLAHLARSRFFVGQATGKKVIVLAGTGGNGGGVLVCARRLHNWGAKVRVFLSKPADYLQKARLSACAEKLLVFSSFLTFYFYSFIHQFKAIFCLFQSFA